MIYNWERAEQTALLPQTVWRRTERVNSIPDELLHQVLLFFAETFQELMTFRTVCKIWREIGNYSPFWIRCPLCILAPEPYRDFIILVMKEYYSTFTIRQGTLVEWMERSMKRKVTVLADVEDCFEKSNTLVKIIVNSLNHQLQAKDEHNIQRAFEISQWYFHLSSQYHSFWNGKLENYANYYLTVRETYQLLYFPIVVTVMILLVLAIYLVDTIYYPVIQPLTTRQHFAFGIIYLCIILDFFLFIRRPLLKFLNVFHLENIFPSETSMRRSNQAVNDIQAVSSVPQFPYFLIPGSSTSTLRGNKQNIVSWYQHASFYVILRLFYISLALLSTLVLIQCKLSFLNLSNYQNPSKGITWAITNLPLWIIFGGLVPIISLLSPVGRSSRTILCYDSKLVTYYYYYLLILFPFTVWCNEIYFSCQLGFPVFTSENTTLTDTGSIHNSLGFSNQTANANQTMPLLVPSECFEISKVRISYMNILLCIPVVFQFILRKLYGIQYQISLYGNQINEIHWRDIMQTLWCLFGVAGHPVMIILFGDFGRLIDNNRPTAILGISLSTPQTILLLLFSLHFSYFTDTRIFAKIISSQSLYENYVENTEL
jgi:hypothetical protein